MDSDSDIEIALRLQATERGIDDESIIALLLNEYHTTNYYDIDEIVESLFYTLNETPTIEHNIATAQYQTNINNLNHILNTNSYELINNPLQSSLVQRYNLQNNIHQNNNILQNPFAELFNIFTGGGNIFNTLQQLPNNNGQMNIQIMANNNGVIHTTGNLMNGAGLGQNVFQSLTDLLSNVQFFNERVPVALTEDALNDIEDISYDDVLKQIPSLDKEDTQCSICFSQLSENSENCKYNILPCHHVFHSDCIKPYLKDYDYLCPICKQDCGAHEAKLNE